MFSSSCFRWSRGPSFNRSSSICRRPESHACFFLFPFLFLWRCRFFRVIFASLPFLLFLVRRVRRTCFSFQVVIFYLVITGWIFLYHLLWEFNQKFNHVIKRVNPPSTLHPIPFLNPSSRRSVNQPSSHSVSHFVEFLTAADQVGMDRSCAWAWSNSTMHLPWDSKGDSTRVLLTNKKYIYCKPSERSVLSLQPERVL